MNNKPEEKAIPDSFIPEEKLHEELENIKNEVKSLIVEYIEPLSLIYDDVDFKGLEVEVEAAMESFEQNVKEATKKIEDMDSGDLLQQLDLDEIKDFVFDGYDICIICTDGNKRDNLEEFIKTEIYPYCSDQQTYTNL